MKFNKYIDSETRELLETQYKEYIKRTPMTRKEQHALREWVKDGNSVYENPSGAWSDGQIPVEFLTVYREEEYLRQQTKGMTQDEARRFALNYYGWSDDECMQDSSALLLIPSDNQSDELPFN